MIGAEKKELTKKARNLRNKMTRAEIYLWMKIKSRQICGYKFRRQQPVLDYIADFYCHALKLIIEIDGEIHSLPEIAKSDKTRDKILINSGYHVLRLSNLEIETDINKCVARIKSLILESLSSQGSDQRRSSR